MPKEIPAPKEQTIENATRIALRAVSACHVPGLGFKAGGHHFVDIWARDELLALPGIVASGQTELAREAIYALLHYQRSDGLIPFRIQRSPSSYAKYKGNPTYFDFPRPNFRSRMNWGVGYVLDGGLLATIASADLFRQTSSQVFAESVNEPLDRNFSWYATRFGNRLITEWPYSEYADAVAKCGRVLYTNVLYVRSLSDFASLSQSPAYLYRADQIKKQLNQTFWNGVFFSDWYDYKRQDYFATHANLLAVVLDVADAVQSEKILAFAREHCLAGFTLETNYPAYPLVRTAVLNILGGVPDYHNYHGMLWLEPGLLYSLALAKLGREDEAREMLTKVAAKIVEYGAVCEVYEQSGKPVKRSFYETERPLLRSAGLFLQAHHALT